MDLVYTHDRDWDAYEVWKDKDGCFWLQEIDGTCGGCFKDRGDLVGPFDSLEEACEAHSSD